MYIQTEDTPNPNSLKFIPGVDVMGDNQPVFIADKEKASISALAESLFSFDFTESIFFGSDFITITKKNDFDWQNIKPDILVTIMEFFITNNKVIKNADVNDPQINENDDEITKQIKEIINERVRPAVARDGGDIIFKEFSEGIVYLELHGACAGCPSSTITLKNGIESMLKHYVPEVMSVEATNE